VVATYYVGTCSWTDRTLIEEGSFYPPSLKNSAERLSFYAQNFNTVEVDSSFYAFPAERNAHLWVERTPASFLFSVYLSQNPSIGPSLFFKRRVT